MSETYDDITAKHYAAFRPSLHSPILSKCIQENEQFSSGLDVGCGTGRSAVALAKYCDSVIGIDPSQEMLNNTIQDPKIKYLNGSLEELTLKSYSFDIITFAGSLHYAKSQKLLDSILCVSATESKIIIYDFEIVLDSVLDSLYVLPNKSKSNYDFEVNFSGLRNGGLKPIQILKEKTNLSVSPSDLTHLVLSEKRTYEQLATRYGPDEVFESSRNILHDRSSGKNHPIEANIFYSIYQKIKKD